MALLTPEQTAEAKERALQVVNGFRRVSDQNACDALNLAETLDKNATEIEVLRNDLNTALGMLAGWCVAIDRNEDWADHYDDAMFRDGPLRAMLDVAIDKARS